MSADAPYAPPPGRGSGAPDELVRTVTPDGGIAVRALIGTALARRARERRPSAPTAASALSRALMGAVLLAVHSGGADAEAEGETVQLQFRGDGELGSVLAISDAAGRVRGLVQNPETDRRTPDGAPDVRRALGEGVLTVVRHHPSWREPYTGMVPLVTGEIAKDLTHYLAASEQVPSAVGLGVAFDASERLQAAGGFLAQALPGASEEALARIEANVHGIESASELVRTGTTADGLLDRVLEGVGGRSRYRSTPLFFCPCTRERALQSLRLLGREELAEMVEEGEEQEVGCQFCGESYRLTPEEMRTLLEAS